MKYPRHVWDQIKNVTAGELRKALKRDGWVRDESTRKNLAYKCGDRRVTIHYHPKKTYRPKLLKALIFDIGWNEEDLRRLGLIS